MCLPRKGVLWQKANYETYRRGRQHFDLGDPIGAARVLAPLAEEEPRNRTVLELLGRSYFHSAQLAKAEEVFRKIIELDPCDAWAHIALARTLNGRTELTKRPPPQNARDHVRRLPD